MTPRATIFWAALIVSTVTCQAASVTTTPSVYTRGSANGSIVGYGYQNTNTGPYGVVAGGSNNMVQTLRGVIGGGSRNVLLGGASDFDKRDSAILSGESNVLMGASAHSVIGGGLRNRLNIARYATLFGWQNNIEGFSTGASNAVISGGWQNTNECWNSVIGGGWHNLILNTNSNPEGAQHSNVIPGGYDNTIQGAYASVIGGGQANALIGPGANNQYGWEVIGGGFANRMGRIGYYNLIAGGTGNRIGSDSTYVIIDSAAILGGRDNLIAGAGAGENFTVGSRNNLTGFSNGAIGFDLTNSASSQIHIGVDNNTKAVFSSAGVSNRAAFGNAPAVNRDFGDVTRVTTTATYTSYGAHNLITGDSVTISGFTEPNFNGVKTVTVTSAASFTYTVANTGAASDIFGQIAFPLVSILADNAVLDTAGRSYIRLRSDNVTAANRTFILNQGSFQGQLLVIEWVGTNAGELIDDSAQSGAGNHRLSATWTPTQYDTLSLVFNGTDWIERGRSTN